MTKDALTRFHDSQRQETDPLGMAWINNEAASVSRIWFRLYCPSEIRETRNGVKLGYHIRTRLFKNLLVYTQVMKKFASCSINSKTPTDVLRQETAQVRIARTASADTIPATTNPGLRILLEGWRGLSHKQGWTHRPQRQKSNDISLVSRRGTFGLYFVVMRWNYT